MLVIVFNMLYTTNVHTYIYTYFIVYIFIDAGYQKRMGLYGHSLSQCY